MGEIVIFQIFIKWPEINIFGHYIAQNVRNDQKNPKMDVTSHVSYRKYENLKKKPQGYKIQQKKICHFWFFVIFGQIVIYMILNFLPKKTCIFSCSFERISVFIAQKLRKLGQNNMCPFFFPSTVHYKI